jgi:RimJ/RimL family protein N-acetyltransferase
VVVPTHLETERLRLRIWEESDRHHFATLNADPIVMGDLGGPLGRDDSDAKLVKLREVLAYTDARNIRSQAVMRRLGLRRDPSRDFAVSSDRLGIWRGLVWAAHEDLIASGDRPASLFRHIVSRWRLA